MARDYSYSRLNWAEERRLKKRTILLGGLTILILVGFLFWGLPGIPRVISLITWGNSGPSLSGVDKTPPPPPVLLTTATATSSAQLIVSGMTEPNATVEIKLNGITAPTVTASSDGTFKSDRLTLIQGDNYIQAVAVDASGNRSQPSNSIAINFDNSKPEITIDHPGDGQQLVGSKQQLLTVSGKIKKQASLTLNQRYVVVSGDGAFSTLYSLTPGTNIINLIATDSAGNVSFRQLSVSFEP